MWLVLLDVIVCTSPYRKNELSVYLVRASLSGLTLVVYVGELLAAGKLIGQVVVIGCGL